MLSLEFSALFFPPNHPHPPKKLTPPSRNLQLVSTELRFPDFAMSEVAILESTPVETQENRIIEKQIITKKQFIITSGGYHCRLRSPSHCCGSVHLFSAIKLSLDHHRITVETHRIMIHSFSHCIAWLCLKPFKSLSPLVEPKYSSVLSLNGLLRSMEICWFNSDTEFLLRTR